MNRKDYETYKKYKEEKSELYNKRYNEFTDGYNNDARELDNIYSDSIDTIKEVEHIIKNAEPSSIIIGTIILAIGLELLIISIPFIVAWKEVSIPFYEYIRMIMYIVVGHLVLYYGIVVDIKTTIECSIKYKKMIEE